jgi:hypothetical protein
MVFAFCFVSYFLIAFLFFGLFLSLAKLTTLKRWNDFHGACFDGSWHNVITYHKVSMLLLSLLWPIAAFLLSLFLIGEVLTRYVKYILYLPVRIWQFIFKFFGSSDQKED